MPRPRDIKVLVLAFAVSPVKGSEFATGWDYIKAIAAHHSVCVLARDNERQEIQQFLYHNPDGMSSVEFKYVPFTRRSFDYPLGYIPYYLLYRYWQWRAYRLARKINSESDVDIVHHLNGTGFREPGYLWKIGKPFVWGPVGGLQYFPWRTLAAVPLRHRFFFLAKNLSTAWAMHIARRPRKAAKAASAIIASTTQAREYFSRLWNTDATVLCEVSTPDLATPCPSRRAPDTPIRLIWSGKFEPRKALNIVLLALGHLKTSGFQWELCILGEGPMERVWRRLAERCGIADQCRFLGRLPRREALEVMASGHVFLQPSLYDSTSTVLVEALGFGLPVICLDHFGFKDVVDYRSGIRIPVTCVDEIVERFADAISFLAQHEDQRYSMARAAHARSADFLWSRKATAIQEIYQRAGGLRKTLARARG